MIDTVILTIPYPDFMITEQYNFSPPATNLFDSAGMYIKFVNNGTAVDRRLGIYLPRLNLYRRPENYYLRIEFSAPKLIYKNNLQELVDSQFDELVDILYSKLLHMGVRITKAKIKAAAVSGFHPSKNILITGGYSATLVIAEIAKVNLTEKLDLEKTKFRNSGHGLQFWAKTHSLVFYDKTADLNKSESRSFGKDQKIQRQSLFDFMERKRKPEILKMETRLANKRKMNTVLKRLGLDKDPTFSDIFKESVCQKILQDYFKTYIEPSLYVFDLSSNPQSMLKRIMRGKKRIRNKDAIYYLGLWELIKDKGVRPLRKIIAPTKSKSRYWSGVSQHLKYLNTLTTASHTHGFIKDIKDSLRKFESYRLPDEPKLPKRDPLEFLKYPH